MTLYILDDDTIELAIWRYALTDNHPSWDIQLFDKADAFRSYVFKHPPDAVVIDLVMPFHPGTEVCAWVKATFPDIKIYINTSLEGDEYPVLAKSYNAVYLSKTTMSVDQRLEVIANGCKS